MVLWSDNFREISRWNESKYERWETSCFYRLRKRIDTAYDFIGANHYTSYFVYKVINEGINFDTDKHIGSSDTDVYGNKLGPRAESGWLIVYPPGIRKAINWIF